MTKCDCGHNKREHIFSEVTGFYTECSKCECWCFGEPFLPYGKYVGEPAKLPDI